MSFGISTDHECSNFDEAIEKKKLGMKIMVREGSSAKNMESLFDYSDRINYWRNHESFGKLTSYEFEKNLTSPLFDFLVSDDKDPKDLLKGHLNSLIKKAESFDIDIIIEAIKMVTINPANHYKLNAGAIINGRKANFVLIDNLKDFNIKKTFVNGEVVYDGCNVLFDSPKVKFKNTFNLNKKEASDFDIILNNRDKVIVRLIRCFNGDLITEESEAILNVGNNIIEADINNDILKIAVVERYGGNTISNAFIKGFNLKKGAIASSIAHDSHNIVVVGTNSEDMAKAVNIIIENKGGLSIVSKDFEKSLALPIGGLMSDKSAEEVAKDLEELHEIANDFGSKLDSPFMTLSFMSLLVMPKLKLSNKGLFSVDLFSFVDLVKD